jgi:hypothetical protein
MKTSLHFCVRLVEYFSEQEGYFQHVKYKIMEHMDIYICIGRRWAD